VNRLLDDRLLSLLLHDFADAASLTELPAFAEHEKETFDLYVDACRRVAREHLFPSYRKLDAAPPAFDGERVSLHPDYGALYAKVRELGVIAATRPESVGGAQLPLTVATLAHAYLMAGNGSVAAAGWLTTGAAHLIEAFGDEALKQRYLARMYEGEWTGTMALTEPQAGSSLADLTTTATPTDDGRYRIRGSKIFIRGGDQDLTENIVHLVLARIEGAPEGTRGVSLFAVPAKRLEEGALVDNDVRVAGVIHKIGWRALPSLALSFGDSGECLGHLVGAPHRGLPQMFQMMNEARISVGVSAAATASVAYHEALGYARDRTQGRPLGVKDPSVSPVPLTQHADVRRMLLRMKSIVEGSLALCAQTARYADLSEHAEDEALRTRSKLLLDLLTPVTKSFPSEAGFEANSLAIQVLGGYGYTSEYLPEALLRDQRLNPIHEGTTGIQSLDLLGRKVVASGGAALRALAEEIGASLEEADAAGVEDGLREPLRAGLEELTKVTAQLGQKGLQGDLDGMLGHSVDYLMLTSTVIVGWMHLRLATIVWDRGDDFARGLVQSARYWAATELPRVPVLAARVASAERSFLDMQDAWFGES